MSRLTRYTWIFSLLLVIALGLWLGSGRIQSGSQQAPEQLDAQQSSRQQPPLPRVRVRTVRLQPVSRRVTLFGRSEADRQSDIRSGIGGRVLAIEVERGDRVRTGQLMMRIDPENRAQELEAARALLAQRQLEYKSSKQLNTQGYQGKAQLAQALAGLKQARAEVSRLEREIADSRITAPFDGIVSERTVETGDWVTPGQTLARLHDLQPLIARGDTSPGDLAQLHTGMPARVRLFGQTEELSARIRYIAPAADPETGTFRIEAAFDNPGARLRAGLAARIDIELDAVPALLISPALFALSDQGELGVKWVRDGIVRFSPIDIIRSDDQGIWITGLEAGSQLITVGQAFVRAGDRVEAVEEAVSSDGADGDTR